KHHIQTKRGKGFWCVAFSPDGRSFAAGDCDGYVRVGNTVTGREIRRWGVAEAQVFDVAYAADGATLYSCGYFLVQSWDPGSGRMKRRFGKRPPLSEIEPGRFSRLSNLAVCPDGTTVSVRDGGRLRSWDTATGREIDRKGLGHVRGSYAISP